MSGTGARGTGAGLTGVFSIRGTLFFAGEMGFLQGSAGASERVGVNAGLIFLSEFAICLRALRRAANSRCFLRYVSSCFRTIPG